MYNSLGAVWHWFRYEFTVLRGAIHCHGFAKLSSDFNLCDTAAKAVKSFECQEKVKLGLISFDTVREIISEGKEAEKKICDYYDNLIFCQNPINHNEWIKPDTHPCRLPYDKAMQSVETDHANLVNTVQRHTKCNSAYCLKVNSNGERYCRFHYPFDTQTSTSIEYKKIKTKSGTVIRSEIVAKQNDPRVNMHHQIQIQGW